MSECDDDMSETANVRTLRNNYTQLLEKVRRGETVTILQRGTPVARLVPPEPPAAIDWSHSAAVKLEFPRIEDSDAMRRTLTENKGRY
jgi:prevent-host-death family protein